MPDAVIAPVGGIQPARARDKSNDLAAAFDRNSAAAPADSPQTQSPEPKPTQPARKLTSSRIDIDAATGRWVIQVISNGSGAVVTQVPSEVQLRIREYAEAGSAPKPHALSRKV